MVEAMVRTLSWLLLARFSLVPTGGAEPEGHATPRQEGGERNQRRPGSGGEVAARSGMVTGRVVGALRQLPNGALFLVHPQSRPGWGDTALPPLPPKPPAAQVRGCGAERARGALVGGSWPLAECSASWRHVAG